jgi:glycosyltransferase involved in cell wall biosynthesis
VPIVAHRHPVFAWVVGAGEAGAGGACIDMAAPGALARCLSELTPAWLAAQAGIARARALELFAQDVVISRYVDLYRAVVK